MSLCFCFFIFLHTQAQKPFVLSFYNLENLFDTYDDSTKLDEEFTPNGAMAYTEDIFRKKLINLSTVISQLGIEKNPEGPVILGVAEIENRYVLEELVKQEKIASRNYKIVHFESPDNRGIDVGMLYNPKYFKLLQARPIAVDLSKLGDTYPTRDVLFVSGKLNGEIMHVFVNHWSSRRGGEEATAPKRKEGARMCKVVIDSIRQDNPNAKIVVMGDLNDDPINESVVEVLKSVGKIKQTHAKNMYNPWLDFYKQGIGTIAYQDAWGLFDQILLSYGFVNKSQGGIQYEGAEVFNRNFLIERFGQYKGYPKRTFSFGKWNDGYSDHFPTIIYLSTN